MEGYLNTIQDEGNEEINERALISIELVFRWLKKAGDEPNNLEARKMMSLASILGGTVIGGDKFKGTGGPHMNSFSWHATIPHGKSTGIMLPYYIVYYAKNPKVMEKLKPIAKMLNLNYNINSNRNDQNKIGLLVAEAMLKWYKSMDFPTRLIDLEGWRPEYLQKALDDAGQNAMKLQAMPNPVPLEKAKEILEPILQAAVNGNLSVIQ
jgi:alcohol dehydrogenase